MLRLHGWAGCQSGRAGLLTHGFNTTPIGSQLISELLLLLLPLHDPGESFTPSRRISVPGWSWAHMTASQLLPSCPGMHKSGSYNLSLMQAGHPQLKGELFTRLKGRFWGWF